MPTFDFKKFVVWGCFLLMTSNAIAAQSKNFKGLFGSYRSENYKDNEGTREALGFNLSLSTLIPVSPVVNSSTTRGSLGETLNFAAFYNFDLEIYYTLWYKWQVFARVGSYSYDTRKESPGGTVQEPIFHLFELSALPLLGGVRYRFGQGDIVPFAQIAAGIASVTRKTIYDNEDAEFADSFSRSYLVGEIGGGFEFFFAPNAGIRMDISAYYMGMDERVFDKGQSAGGLAQKPIMTYRANPWLVRYSGGVFFFF